MSTAAQTARRYDKRGRAESIRGARRRLYLARDSSDLAITLADDVALLMRWLRHDILTVAGPSHAERCALYDFVVAELKSRVPLCSIGCYRSVGCSRISEMTCWPSHACSTRSWSGFGGSSRSHGTAPPTPGL